MKFIRKITALMILITWAILILEFMPVQNGQAPVPVIKPTNGVGIIAIGMIPKNLSLTIGMQTFNYSSKNTFLVSSNDVMAYQNDTKLVIINFTINTATNLIFNETFIKIGIGGLVSGSVSSMNYGNLWVYSMMLPGKYQLMIAPNMPVSPVQTP